jgi:ATP-dependent RNA helicase DDX19/DBP5
MAEVTETTAASSSEGQKPAVPETKRLWSDEVDDEEVQPSATEEKAVSELKVDALAIDENTKVNKFLDEPEDSRIQAVLSPPPLSRQFLSDNVKIEIEYLLSYCFIV